MTQSFVSVIDEELMTLIATIPVGNNARYIDINPVTNKIYVSNEASKNISVIDGANNEIVTTIPVQYFPKGIAVNQVSNRIYVALGDGNQV